jgi:hypothetical protein
VPNDVEIAIIHADFAKHMLRPVPLIHHFLNRVLVLAQPKANGPFIRLPPRVALHLDSHTRAFSRYPQIQTA